MPFRCTPPTPHAIDTMAHHPWTLWHEPFQVAPRTWYVAGQTWVGSYLIDTGDGLVLIDTAVAESTALLVESIHRAGFDPRVVKKILLSHAHVDHCGGAGIMAALTGAEVWMSREDLGFMHACPDETIDLDPRLHAMPFEPDELYDPNEPVTLGDVAIRCVPTPGHTIGCTSFLWDVTNPANGERYTVGMHGGVGANTMNDDYYEKSHYLTPDLRDRFIADLEPVGDLHVDIALPSHPNQIEVLDRAGTYTDETQPFLDPSVWKDFLTERVRQVREWDPAAVKRMMA